MSRLLGLRSYLELHSHDGVLLGERRDLCAFLRDLPKHGGFFLLREEIVLSLEAVLPRRLIRKNPVLFCVQLACKLPILLLQL